jgi:hypothetical protein
MGTKQTAIDKEAETKYQARYPVGARVGLTSNPGTVVDHEGQWLRVQHDGETHARYVLGRTVVPYAD